VKRSGGVLRISVISLTRVVFRATIYAFAPREHDHCGFADLAAVRLRRFESLAPRFSLVAT
jgi:hypothetical protein